MIRPTWYCSISGFQEWTAMKSVAGCATRDCRTSPIIALTGYGQQDRGRLEDRGFDNYIVKPCPLPELLRLIDSAMRH
jgi:CheY-like chemotaxis protein